MTASAILANVFLWPPPSVSRTAQKLSSKLYILAGVTAGLAESNGNLPPSLWLTTPAGWLPRTGISSGTLRSVIEYGLPLRLLHCINGSRTRMPTVAASPYTPITKQQVVVVMTARGRTSAAHCKVKQRSVRWVCRQRASLCSAVHCCFYSSFRLVVLVYLSAAVH